MFVVSRLCPCLVCVLPVLELVCADGTAVHHGKYFTPPDKIERLDAPQLQTQPSTPPQAIQPASGGNRSSALDAIQPSLSSLLARKMEESIAETVPFYCHGFV